MALCNISHLPDSHQKREVISSASKIAVFDNIVECSATHAAVL